MIPKLELVTLSEVMPQIYVIRSLLKIKLQNQLEDCVRERKGKHDLQAQTGLWTSLDNPGHSLQKVLDSVGVDVMVMSPGSLWTSFDFLSFLCERVLFFFYIQLHGLY